MRAEIARVVPFYEGSQHLRETGDAVQYGGPHLCVDGHFSTPDGKGQLHAVELPDRTRPPGKFRISTRRGKQFNSLIYADDAATLYLVNGDAVRLRSEVGAMDGHVFLAPISRGDLQVHWPEGNVLIRSGVVDAGGGVPEYYAWVAVELTAADQARAGRTN